MKQQKIQKEWDTHWKKVKTTRSLFGNILEWYRLHIIASAVRYYFERYFPKKGIFVEMGSGTSQTSSRIEKHKRTLIALDISKLALMEAKKIPQIDRTIQGDIFSTKLQGNSIDGIWNLGVMEHFDEKDILKILAEFNRVLKKGSYVILFWPPRYGSSELALGAVEKVLNVFKRLSKKEEFHFFPGEITRLRSKAHARRIIDASQLDFVKAFFNHRDAYTHIIVVCRKKRG
jgi:SAM-dependent methyltransferase